jgi:hypothetical protein
MAKLNGAKYNVGGVALDRPFKIRRFGHFGFNALGWRVESLPL